MIILLTICWKDVDPMVVAIGSQLAQIWLIAAHQTLTRGHFRIDKTEWNTRYFKINKKELKYVSSF